MGSRRGPHRGREQVVSHAWPVFEGTHDGLTIPVRRRATSRTLSTEAMLVLAVLLGGVLATICFQLRAHVSAAPARVAAARAFPAPPPVPVTVARVEAHRQEPAVYVWVPPAEAAPCALSPRIAKPGRRWTKKQAPADKARVLADLREGNLGPSF